ncbi:transketolase family protein [Candidatus Nitrosopelagicus sp.]|nr:transketolase family protein [Candidatus Nitrosopelagicus sp.]
MLATRDAFGVQLLKSSQKNNNIIVLSADLSKPTRTEKFAKEFPDRFFEIGIAESNMIGIGSGLSEYGFKVVMTSFATFLTGKYDVIRVSLAYSNSPVILVGTHGGLAIGKDGVTQMGLEDISLMRSLPNMIVMQPATAIEAEKMVDYLLTSTQTNPVYLRLGRQPVPEVFDENYQFIPNKGVVCREGKELAIFVSGCLLDEVFNAVNDSGKDCAIINIHTIKPFDKEILLKYAKQCGKIITVEDHSIIGGLGSAVSEILSEEYPTLQKRIGLNDIFPESGSPTDLWEKYGISKNAIKKSILDFI